MDQLNLPPLNVVREGGITLIEMPADAPFTEHAVDLLEREFEEMRFWIELDWDRDTKEISDATGFSQSYVAVRRKQFAPHTIDTRSNNRADWSQPIDWTKSFQEIADQVGVSRERARQKYRSLVEKGEIEPVEGR